MSEANIIHHLGNLVEMYPVTHDQTAVRGALGYCVDVLEGTGSFPDATIHRNDDIYSLTASTRATKWPKLLLQGHIDVVPALPSQRKLEFTESGLVKGRGVHDMLFATACYLNFIEEHSDLLDKMDLGIMLTGDEELAGFRGAKYLLDSGYGAEICFLPDAGHGFGDLSVAAKGVYNFAITARGVQHHASRPWEGDGAGNKMVKLLHELSESFPGTNPEEPTMTVSRLAADGAENAGPAEASARVDIRYATKEEHARVMDLLQDVCLRYDAEISDDRHGSHYEIDRHNPHVKRFIELYAARVDKVTQSVAYGSSDARFFSELGIPVIMTVPDGAGEHGDDESLSLDSLDRFYELLKTFTLETATLEE